MAHEDLHRTHSIEASSNRAFGLVFGAFFLLIACWPLLYRESVRWWALGIALIFAFIAVAKPTLLARPNRLWLDLGLLLGKIVSPLVLGVVFFAVFTPIGLVVRLTGKDPLRLKFDCEAKSYWIERKPPGPPPNSMSNQF